MKSSRSSLFGKFVVAFVSVGLLPVLIIGIYFSNRFRHETHTMMSDSYHQVAIYSMQNLDNVIDRYNNITRLLYNYNPEHSVMHATDGLGLARILATNGSEVELLRKRVNVTAFLRVVSASDSFIRNSMFVEADDTIHVCSQGVQQILDETSLLVAYDHAQAYEKTNQLILIPTHHDGYFRGADNRVFTVGRNYLNLARPVGEEDIIGTLYMNVDIRAIENIFSHLEVYNTSEIIVKDEYDRVIYANPIHYYWQDIAFSPAPGNLIEISEQSPRTGWTVSIRADYGRAMGNVVDLIRLIYIIIGVVLVALLIISILYSRAFSRPIHVVLEGMKQVEEGNFNVDVKVKAIAEMKQLAEGFNSMAHQLRGHIETVFLSQLRRREAQLGALKMQINPHYLYNSLEIIQMNAIANDDESTAELVLLLADQMRYALGKIGEKVPISREFEVLRSYFTFIGIRYDNRITWEITEDATLKDSQVLSLIIQPVVENAVQHGLKPKGGGHIQITTERRGNDMAIIIMDNGVGITDDKVTTLMEQLEQGEDWQEQLEQGKDWQEQRIETDSIGLKNVHDRLRYKYGKPYGITIRSQLQIGTSVTLLLPLNGKDSESV